MIEKLPIIKPGRSLRVIVPTVVCKDTRRLTLWLETSTARNKNRFE
jgi:hypothetical protein